VAATRLSLRTALRLRLEDSTGSPLWADADLNEALTEGLRAYGVRFPQQLTATVSVLVGTTSYALPAGVVPSGIVAVLDGDGDFIPRDRAEGSSPGPANATGMLQAWSTWGTTLFLAVKPGTAETFTLRYLAGRELITDDVSAQPVEAGDEPIVLAWAAAWALDRRSVEDAKRSDRAGAATRRLAEQARSEVERLISGRNRRVRQGWLS
jgi:hypothetical protein